jgi:ATP/maltotriose-dependent transcriptional regulator MalT
LLVQLCELELRAGRPSGAIEALEEWEERDVLELPEALGGWARLRAALAALEGKPQEAVVLAAPVLEAGESDTFGWDRLEALRARGLAALLERRFEQATADLGTVWEHIESAGITDPGMFPVAGDLVEVLVESGSLDAANHVLARLGSLVADQRHPWGLATVRRSTAVVTLADGYDEAAAAELAQAAADYGTLGCAFESARALLFLGRVQRRSKKRAAARQSLEHARSAFAELVCPGWEQAASAELERISGRRKTAEGGLTPSEQRVAELVASGLSNKEIAGQLFVSVYTVEAHLSSVYAKLGIRSRTQLASQLRTRA